MAFHYDMTADEFIEESRRQMRIDLEAARSNAEFWKREVERLEERLGINKEP